MVEGDDSARNFRKCAGSLAGSAGDCREGFCAGQKIQVRPSVFESLDTICKVSTLSLVVEWRSADSFFKDYQHAPDITTGTSNLEFQ